MSRLITRPRFAQAALAVMLAGGLSACSGGIDRSEYTSPIAANSVPAPSPVVPVMASGTSARPGRLPLLPPVPDEQSGLPPVTMAQLLPPPPIVH